MSFFLCFEEPEVTVLGGAPVAAVDWEVLEVAVKLLFAFCGCDVLLLVGQNPVDQ